MVEIQEMIRQTERDLAQARIRRDATPGPRKFLEIDAFAAAIRLRALRDALTALDQG